MRWLCRFHRRVRATRDVVLVGAALCGFLVANLGLPLIDPASLATAQKDKSKPFPCQDRPCGCMSADACMRSCCCFTANERLAWAKAHDVEPIPELVAAAKQESATSHEPCEHAGACNHCDHAQTVAQTQPPSRAKCCSSKAASQPGTQTHPATAGKPEAGQAHDAVTSEEASANEESSDGDWRVIWIVGSLASKCQGLGPMSPLSFPTLPPVPTVDYLHDWCCGNIVPCDQPHFLSAIHQPPTRPPCC